MYLVVHTNNTEGRACRLIQHRWNNEKGREKGMEYKWGEKKVLECKVGSHHPPERKMWAERQKQERDSE